MTPTKSETKEAVPVQGTYAKDPRYDRFVHWALTALLSGCVLWFGTRFDNLEHTLQDLGTKFEVQAEKLAQLVNTRMEVDSLKGRVMALESRVYEMNERRIKNIEEAVKARLPE